jgi:hypothetical protein
MRPLLAQSGRSDADGISRQTRNEWNVYQFRICAGINQSGSLTRDCSVFAEGVLRYSQVVLLIRRLMVGTDQAYLGAHECNFILNALRCAKQEPVVSSSGDNLNSERKADCVTAARD